jgi:hypothetical protein
LLLLAHAVMASDKTPNTMVAVRRAVNFWMLFMGSSGLTDSPPMEGGTSAFPIRIAAGQGPNR